MYLRTVFSIIAAVPSFACGPEVANVNGLVGTYSTRSAGLSTHDSNLLHYEIDQDGGFTFVRVGSAEGGACNNIRGAQLAYTWNALSGKEIEVAFPDRALGADAWRISRGPGCSMKVRPVNAGVVSTNAMEFTRGAVCFEVPKCPEGEICGGCSLVWCDEAPPPCEDDQ